jgi:hypothetical protein
VSAKTKDDSESLIRFQIVRALASVGAFVVERHIPPENVPRLVENVLKHEGLLRNESAPDTVSRSRPGCRVARKAVRR